jgi:predicted Rossmann fold nucleotide-binding protein DprA/Smf involved in DNA uptake
MNIIGNNALLSLKKTAFLCSRKIPASTVLKCYDWAIEQREQGTCVISGFQSQIEKDVLHYLLPGSQPIIIALAKGLRNPVDPLVVEAFSKNRILVVSPFGHEVTRVTVETAQRRNRMMIEMADEVVFGYISRNGNLDKLKSEHEPKKKIKLL